MPFVALAFATVTEFTSRPILQRGRNCWRIERAARFAMLVDADCYFRAVRSAILQAQHSIFILSWDIDSRMRLIPGGANDGYPEELGEFLRAVVAERAGLHVYVLNWDFAMLYALEREWLPHTKLGWNTHERLAFRMDGSHPVGASHHQKVVVIDDALAFVGGLDLTRSRWDTPAHRKHDTLRCDTDGKAYPPFHDVQAAVDTTAAHALGELCRMRWLRATASLPVPVVDANTDCWPPYLQPDMRDVDVGISRTEPAYAGRTGVIEVKQLHLDAIGRACTTLFFENQYFTAGLIAEALAARLHEANGPEVIVISPQNQSGWLEESTMGVLRARLQRRLRLVDRYDRFRLLCPLLPSQKNNSLNVHSKVFVVDERLFSIGSANLSNRSMAFDTECNLSVEANRREIADGIARLRSRLLAEHLDQTPEQVLQLTRQHHSLLVVIRTLANHERRLESFEPQVTPELDALLPQQALFDPERPINAEQLLAQLLPKDAREPLPRRLAGLALLAVLLLGLAMAWHFQLLGNLLNPTSLVAYAQELEALPLTPIFIMLAYVIGGLLLVPVSLLIAVTGLVFGALPGALYAMAGALLSAATGYGIGAWAGRDTVRRWLGGRINRLSRRLGKRGILAMIVVRALPLAPFSIVNIVAGASHISLRDYLIGTALGLAPGILLTTTFAHHLMLAIRSPRAENIAVLLIVVLLLIGFALFMQRLLRRRPNVDANGGAS